MHWLALRPSKIEEEKGFDETEHNVRRKVDEVKVQKMELPKLKDDSKWRKIDFKALVFQSKGSMNGQIPASDASPVAGGGTKGSRRSGIAAALIARAKQMKAEDEAAAAAAGVQAGSNGTAVTAEIGFGGQGASFRPSYIPSGPRVNSIQAAAASIDDIGGEDQDSFDIQSAGLLH